jgi:hypothetical protein
MVKEDADKAWFLGDKAESTFESYEKTSVKVPTRTATVTDMLKVLLSPEGKLHLTEVSESQTVESAAEKPIFEPPVYSNEEKLLPYTVTLTDPVDGLFEGSNEERLGISYENASVRLPARNPTVISTLKVLETPLGTLHTTALSAVQSVASPAVSPTRTAWV